MILVTGGLGFIGSHTVRALLDLGETCVVTQHRSTDVPRFLREDLDRRAFLAHLDVMEPAAVLALHDKYPIDGIVHFVGAMSMNPFNDMRDATNALANVLEAANAWKVKRVCVASAIGVYGAPRDSQPMSEAAVVPLAGNPHTIIAQKKAVEIYAEFLAASLGIDCVVLRIAGIYGPRYRGMRTFVSRLAHAVARSQPLDLAGVRFGAGPDDGGDWCYVKDCARGIALLQTTPTLTHRTYNVGSGVVTRNREFVAAIPEGVLDANFEIAESHDVAPVVAALDITRLQEDTGYEPRFNAKAGCLDYVVWLRNGNSY